MIQTRKSLIHSSLSWSNSSQRSLLPHLSFPPANSMKSLPGEVSESFHPSLPLMQLKKGRARSLHVASVLDISSEKILRWKVGLNPIAWDTLESHGQFEKTTATNGLTVWFGKKAASYAQFLPFLPARPLQYILTHDNTPPQESCCPGWASLPLLQVVGSHSPLTSTVAGIIWLLWVWGHALDTAEQDLILLPRHYPPQHLPHSKGGIMEQHLSGETVQKLVPFFRMELVT